MSATGQSYWEKIFEKWFGNFLDRFTQIDDKLDVVIGLLKQLIERRIRAEVTVTPTVPFVVEPEALRSAIAEALSYDVLKKAFYEALKEIEIDNMYDTYTIDLTVAHEDEPLLKGKVTPRVLVVTKADSTFYIKINDVAAKRFTAYEGFAIRSFEINEIYVTNTAATGQGEIAVFWRE